MATYSMTLDSIQTLTATRAYPSGIGPTDSSTYTVPAGKIAIINTLGFFNGWTGSGTTSSFRAVVQAPGGNFSVFPGLSVLAPSGGGNSLFTTTPNSYLPEGTQIRCTTAFETGTGTSGTNTITLTILVFDA